MLFQKLKTYVSTTPVKKVIRAVKSQLFGGSGLNFPRPLYSVHIHRTSTILVPYRYRHQTGTLTVPYRHRTGTLPAPNWNGDGVVPVLFKL
jgi:hypothetical protein